MMTMTWTCPSLNVVDLDYKDYLLEKVGEEKLFSLAFPDYKRFDLNEYYRNPLRKDNNPGAFFDYVDDNLVFRDFAFGNKPLDVFTFLSLYYGLNIYELIVFLQSNPLVKRRLETVKIIPLKKRRTRNSKSLNTSNKRLFVLPMEFTDDGLDFWLGYGLDKEILEKEFVYQVKSYIYSGVHIEPEDLTFAYGYPELGRLKLYKPYGNPKFLSDINHVLSGYYDTKKDYIVITKSKKDYMVLKYILKLNTAFVEGESMFMETDKLKSFKKIIISYDNDKTGIMYAEKRRKELIALFPDIEIYTVIPKSGKDWSDILKQSSYKKLMNEFKTLLNEKEINIRTGWKW